ncbi:hypothetical protein AWY96_06285 [Serratia plymuthica]|nr:hypothetical protein AWY96_06285 [Serratia plymuthica]
MAGTVKTDAVSLRRVKFFGQRGKDEVPLLLVIYAPHYGYFSLSWGFFLVTVRQDPGGKKIKSAITRPGYWAAGITINACWFATYDFD